ncbi:MAG: pyridoxamine 5'-phosphate oxidase family protein [Archangium sp.]|nr:pyridoxamine 5'-phosphate oxidase family protein [Archangium sp.]MDP3152172.1 pyridoxamine 5'-phosphate oxidase family protein [Archangium sp.]MDP3574946.1 pyridoxamine 5'-phosphate oxidase family protein [Archangium sp.]
MKWLEVFETQRARNRPGNRVQVATVDERGAPSLRTVVLRGFTRGGQPWFFTDARSEKIHHLQRSPHVSVLAWWERTEDQFRLDGLATVHGPGAVDEAAVLRKTSWQRLAGRRAAWLGPAPGSVVGPPSLPPAADTAEPPENFVVVTVTVARVDWLRLAGAHSRVRFTRTGDDWLREELVP